MVGITVGITVIILLVQAWGSYDLIQKIFRWLALALFSYVAAAFLARPQLSEVLIATAAVALLDFDDEVIPGFAPWCTMMSRYTVVPCSSSD